MSETSRRLAVPSSVSEAAQRFLEAGPAPTTPTWPALDDTEAWLTLIAEADRAIAQRFDALASIQLPLDVSEADFNGVAGYVLRPDAVANSADTPIYIDFHGGGLIYGGGDLCRLMAIPPALGRSMITWAVDYRMPPRHPYPAAIDDAVAAFDAALAVRPPGLIFVGGGSAGGNVAAALIIRLKELSRPMPAGLVLITPEVDLTESGDTFTTLLGVDSVLTSSLMPANLLYAGGRDLSDPHLSPLFGHLTGFPPTFLQSGTRDLFLSNTVRMHRRLRAAGVRAELHVWEAMPHGGFAGAPEDAELAGEVRSFLESRLDELGSGGA